MPAIDPAMVAGIGVPFLGTILGSALVLLLKGDIKPLPKRILMGFAAGVMVAASIWSLLIPSMEMSGDLGKLAFLPAFIGFWLGIALLLALDRLIPHLHLGPLDQEPEGPHTNLARPQLMVLAVTLHNIPEGMATGMVFAGMLSGNGGITLAAALALSVGMAIQNIPEGTIISTQLRGEGRSKLRSFIGGVLSGAVEPLGACIAILTMGIAGGLLPYFLSLAAGAMLYVVVEELIPEMSEGEHTNWAVIAFAAGFTLMMALDVALA